MPSRLKPKDQKRLDQARTAMAGGRYDEAIELYQRLLEKHRMEPGILLPLAQCYIARRKLGAAEKLLNRLEDNATTNGPLLVAVGHAYDQLRRTDRALAVLSRALNCGLTMPQQIAVRAGMASAAERLNDLPQARTHVDFLLEHAPESFTTRLMAGILARREGDGPAAETHLQKTIDQGAPSAELRARAGYELARVLDRQGRYDDAFATAQAAKAVALPGRAGAMRQSDWVATLTKRLTQLFAASNTEMPTPTPTSRADTETPEPAGRRVCLLTGHPRSGTTLLEQMLDSHSQLVSADETSTLLQQVFQPLVGSSGQDLSDPQLQMQAVPASRLAKARTNYISHLERITGDNDPNHWLIDKNPEAVVMIPALQRAVPRAKVIMVIRDPRDVVLSCYFQYLSVNPVSVNYDTLANTATKYARTMSLWLAMRDRLARPWLEVRYEALVDDPEGQIRRVLGFLGLDFEAGVLAHDRHVRDKVVQSPTYQAVAKPVYRDAVGRWRHYEAHFGPARETLAPLIATLGYGD